MINIKRNNSKKLILVIAILVLVSVGILGTNIMTKNGNSKKLIVGRANDAISLDPAITTEGESFKVTVNIYENLVKYSDNGSEIMPSLAESWKTSEDGLTWVFHLRKGIKFHDGTKFDAKSVEFNFHRWMNSESPYHTGQFSYWRYNFGGFPGVVKSVTALSDYSVEIVLSKPYSPFLSVLATPAFGIASPDAIMTYNEMYYQHPVGTGPFKYKSWVKGESITLERNNEYSGQKAKLGEIEFKVIPSRIDRIKQLENGQIHMADNLTTDDILLIQGKEDIVLYRRPFFNVGYLALNNSVEPFTDKRVRLAVNHLIDKEKLIEEVFNNLEREANTFLPPVLWGYNESIKPYKHDVAKAKELLKEAGYEELKIDLWVMDVPRPYMSKPIEVAQFIKESLKEGGIDVDVKIFKWDEYIEKIKDGNFQMALVGWNGDTLDPDNFLYTFLASENAATGIASNYSFYINDEVDQMLEAARQVTDVEFRKNIYRDIQEIVHKDVPSIPLVHTMPTLAARKSVKGYVPNVTGEEVLGEVELDFE